MSLTPARDRGAFAPKGGGIIRIKEVNDDATDLTTTASVYDIGFLQETTIKDMTALTEVKDEAGDTVQTIEDDRSVSVEVVLMQRDKTTLDIAKEARGKFFALYKYNGIVNGKHQEIFYGLGKIDPSFEVKLAGGTVPFKFTAIKLPSTITIPATVACAAPTGGAGAWGAYTSATVTIAKDDYYAIIESTVA